MSIIANRIAKKINLDVHMKQHSYAETKKFWVNKIRKIEVSSTPIKIKLTEEAYNNLFER